MSVLLNALGVNFTFLACFSAAAKHDAVEADFVFLYFYVKIIWNFVCLYVWSNILCKIILCCNIDRSRESQQWMLVEEL